MTAQDKQALDRVQFEQNELKQRVDALVEQMEKFRTDAMRLLTEMAAAPMQAPNFTLENVIDNR